MNEQIERIRQMPRAEVLEAVLALESELEKRALKGVEEEALAALVEDHPYEYIAEIDDLGRFALIMATLDPELEPIVINVLDKTGAKTFVFGGAEILAAGVVGVLALRVILSRGRAREKTRVEMTLENGKPKVVLEQEIVYDVSGKLAGLVGNVLSKYMTGGSN